MLDGCDLGLAHHLYEVEACYPFHEFVVEVLLTAAHESLGILPMSGKAVALGRCRSQTLQGDQPSDSVGRGR